MPESSPCIAASGVTGVPRSLASLRTRLRAVIVVSLPVKALCVPHLWNCVSFPPVNSVVKIAISWGRGRELFSPADDTKRLYPLNNRKA